YPRSPPRRFAVGFHCSLRPADGRAETRVRARGVEKGRERFVRGRKELTAENAKSTENSRLLLLCVLCVPCGSASRSTSRNLPTTTALPLTPSRPVRWPSWALSYAP